MPARPMWAGGGYVRTAATDRVLERNLPSSPKKVIRSACAMYSIAMRPRLSEALGGANAWIRADMDCRLTPAAIRSRIAFRSISVVMEFSIGSSCKDCERADYLAGPITQMLREPVSNTKQIPKSHSGKFESTLNGLR